jgi:aryl-alcohol dehydrogenase (NADP+)
MLDTACSYAAGESERIIGRWLARQDGALRRSVRIATKVGTVVCGTDIRIDLSPRTMADQLGGSLERLGLECVDLCLSHAPDEHVPIEATLEGCAGAPKH